MSKGSTSIIDRRNEANLRAAEARLLMIARHQARLLREKGRTHIVVPVRDRKGAGWAA